MASIAGSKQTRRGAHLREASFDDYHQILLLESSQGAELAGYQQWCHLWLENPLRRQLRSWPIGWVIEDHDGQIAGSIGCVPLPYEFDGEPLVAVIGRNCTANPAYEGAASLLQDQVMNQAGADLYIDNAATPERAASACAFDCLPAPAGIWDESAFWITHPLGFAINFLRDKGIPLDATLRWPLAAWTGAKDFFTAKVLPVGDVDVRFCYGFDYRFDDFWESYRRRNPHLLLAVRSRRVLEWRFKFALRSQRLWIATVSDGGRLAAYALFDRKQNPREGLTRLRLVDFVSLEPGSALLAPILSRTLRKCAREGIHLLEATGCWLENGELIDVFAPYRRNLPSWSYFYRANRAGLAEKLSSRRAWSPTLYDGNATL
jgi:hypothetical protein